MTHAPQAQLQMQGIDPLQDKRFLVQKRDGRIEEFNEARILLAIESAFKAHHGLPPDATLPEWPQAAARACADKVVERVLSRAVRGEELEVERIQDTVEDQLMTAGHLEVARRYILYREMRRVARTERESRAASSATIEEASNNPKMARGAELPELRSIYREALPRRRASEGFEDVYRRHFDGCLNEGDYWRVLSPELLEFDSDRLARRLRLERDQEMAAAPLAALRDHYLLREQGRCLETPQYFWMRIAMGLALRENERQEERALDFYEALSTFRFIPSDAILRRAGTRQPALVGGVEAEWCSDWIEAWSRDILEAFRGKSPRVPDLFMKRVREGSTWTLFDPAEAGDLQECSGREFERRYIAREQKAKQGALRFAKRVKAADLWHDMVGGVAPNGTARIGFRDAMGLRSPLHCGASAAVPAGAINLAAHIPEGTGALDLAQLRGTITLAVRMLDNAVDLNVCLTEQARRDGLEHRGIGLGVIGFQEALERLHPGAGSQAAPDFADWSMELVSHGAIMASAELACERGAFPRYRESKWSEDILPIDTLGQLSQERGLMVDVPADTSQDWESVREKIRRHGMRHDATTVSTSIETPAIIAGLMASIDRGLGGEEIDAKCVLECAARRQKWMDLGQTLTMRTAETEPGQLADLYTKAWEKGLPAARHVYLTAPISKETKALPAGVFA